MADRRTPRDLLEDAEAWLRNQETAFRGAPADAQLPAAVALVRDLIAVLKRERRDSLEREDFTL